MNDDADEFTRSALVRVYELLLRKADEAEAEARRREQQDTADDTADNPREKRKD